MNFLKDNPLSFESLNKENQSILVEISKIQKLLPAVSARNFSIVKEKFLSFSDSCSLFNASVITDLDRSRLQARRFMSSIQSKKSENSKFDKKRLRIHSQEVLVGHRDREWQASLDQMRGLWLKNLTEMERSVWCQQETLKRIGSKYLNKMTSIEKEMQEVLNGPKVPHLHLEVLAKAKIPLSARSSSSVKPSDDDDIISNKSAFSYKTDEFISHRSDSSRPRLSNLRRANPPLPPALPSRTINNSLEINESLEFEKIMQEIDKAKQHPEVSMDKTSEGWKSEYETESENTSLHMNADEIKKALLVLKRARLLNPGANQFLVKLADMMKVSEASSNVELMLQLINIERKKGKNLQKMTSRPRAAGKPPTPTNSKRCRKAANELVEASRDKFMFSEERSFIRSMSYSDIQMSPKNNESFGESFIAPELNDVNLEDLLNVPSIVDKLGLISADVSLVEEEATKEECKGFEYLKPPPRLSKRLPVIS